jgi:uncharacterized protein involved in outer membrane biogenesis
MKKIGKIISVLILLMIVLVIFVVTNLDRGIKAAVENLGPEMTQSPVTLSSVDLSLTTAKGRFSGLRVGNPQGFSAPDAFALGEISFAMDADSLATDTIIIDSLRIVAPEITMERADGRSNLDQIQANIASYLGESSDPSSTEESAKKFVIRDLRIIDGKVHYTILGGKSIDLPLPDLQLTGIGQSDGESEGVSAAEAAGEIINAIVGAAGKAVSQSGAVKDIGRSLEDQIKEKAGALKGLFDRKK